MLDGNTAALNRYTDEQAVAAELWEVERECKACRLVCPSEWFTVCETVCNECIADGVIKGGFFIDADDNAIEL